VPISELRTHEDVERLVEEMCRALDEEARDKGGPAKTRGRRKSPDG
jgi:hypothetical protein